MRFLRVLPTFNWPQALHTLNAMQERMHLRGEPNLQLSPREHQVLELIRLGMTNRQIAQRLLVSTNTINKHVEHLLGKLDVRNRVQAAVWSRERT